MDEGDAGGVVAEEGPDEVCALFSRHCRTALRYLVIKEVYFVYQTQCCLISVSLMCINLVPAYFNMDITFLFRLRSVFISGAVPGDDAEERALLLLEVFEEKEMEGEVEMEMEEGASVRKLYRDNKRRNVA